MSILHSFLKHCLLLGFLVISPLALSDSLSISVDDGNEMEVIQYPARGDKLMVVLPSEHGVTDGLTNLALSLQKQGVETWIAAPFSSLMLPNLESSLKKIPLDAYVKLLNKAESSGKKIYLFSNDNGTENLLLAARQWQLKKHALIYGVILISPNFYITTPTAGNNGLLLPIVRASNLPVFIFLPAKSTLTLQIKDTVKALEQGGSDVFVQVLKNVRARFFFRNDATDAEVETFPKLSKHIIRAMKVMTAYARPRKPAPLAKQKQIVRKKTTGKLQQYTGTVTSDNFSIRDINNKQHSLQDYQGKVVIVNFWASWCPPCVHEMPSMSALKDKIGADYFDILAINLGEPAEDIAVFLKAHPVNFPILPDPQQKLAKTWKVFAFPTSYIIDKKGNIRYSVAGGIDWNTPQVRQVIEKLLKED